MKNVFAEEKFGEMCSTCSRTFSNRCSMMNSSTACVPIVKETDKDYQLSIEMPGFKKDEIKVSLENGYLTVSAEKDEKQEEGQRKCQVPAQGMPCLLPEKLLCRRQGAGRGRQGKVRERYASAHGSQGKSPRRSPQSRSQSNNRLPRRRDEWVGNDHDVTSISRPRVYPAGSFFCAFADEREFAGDFSVIAVRICNVFVCRKKGFSEDFCAEPARAGMPRTVQGRIKS